MCSRIPYLPDEVHLLIGQFVSRNDLPNYRLASKSCCAIGTAELFGTLTFDYSTASFERLRQISKHDHLRKCVKTLFWDVNLWRIPNVRDLNEWQEYFHGKASSPGTCPSEARTAGLEHLALDRKEWGAYLDKVTDERKARGDGSLLEILERFHNRRAVHIVHGTLSLAHRGVKKMKDGVHSASVEPPVLHRGEGMNDHYSRPGFEAFELIQQMIPSRLSKIKLDRIHYTSFIKAMAYGLDQLTSLDLKLTARSDRLNGLSFNRGSRGGHATKVLGMGGLRVFLRELQQLESLKIDLDGCHDTWPSCEPMCCVEDVFGSDSAWPQLRKLSLCCFLATPDSLVGVCQRHGSTLKDLRLGNIIFSNDVKEEPPSFEVATREEKCAASGMPLELRAWPDVLEYLGQLELVLGAISSLAGAARPR
ncbi:hypothetical protein ACJQWK_03672 [Exserohilum turcicum]|uniref:F-box domain-containing protein n=1 Tax=Exserohilum turcicum (strain 28A) TaxID=671987 RepID=R0KFH6_EXST2|nr:uncharacterized protein SETTUDRAFT_18251 [Exserohilum turcica Et28A]EOA91573.1 hypothetical protein SETTUDRAFT_18251 [Exserohilum turcica Et28A]